MFKFDTTLQVHLELRSIRLAPPTGLDTTLVAFSHVSMPPFFSGLNWQTTQTGCMTSEKISDMISGLTIVDAAPTEALSCNMTRKFIGTQAAAAAAAADAAAAAGDCAAAGPA
jgi:hypothetical protein